MNLPRLLVCVWSCVLMGATTLASTDPATADAALLRDGTIRYHVRLPERHAHRVHVEMTVPTEGAEHVDLSLPVWSPGSYLVREYARHVVEWQARNAHGDALVSAKLDKNTWRVVTGGADPVVVSYELYANERSVRTSEVNSDHAFLQSPGTFFRHAPAADGPHRVTVEAPAGWEVFTGLASDGDGFLAADYDELADCPLEIGPHEALDFEVRGVPHRMVLAGGSDVDAEQLRDDVAEVCEEVATIFDGMPFDDYTFLFLLLDSGGGGLEHHNSSVCMINRWNLGKQDRYRGFLSLVAHEYFHAWNVKRFRPQALGPFDYDVENYTPDLWVAEGITSYFDDLSILRAEFADGVGRYLDGRASAFRSEAESVGARRMSLERSSHDAWIKHYRPDENSGNVAISYYSKGALVALLLDLRIRRLTDGARRLHDVLRLGWERYTEAGVGFPPGAVAELASEVAGSDLGPFFADFVSGTTPLSPDEDLAWVGLRLAVEPEKAGDRPLAEDDDGFPLEPGLGLTTRSRDGLLVVERVVEDGPAWNAGLNHDDVLLGLNGWRLSASNLRDRLDRSGGEPVDITYWRGETLRRARVRPELERLSSWKLTSVDEPTEAQFAAFEAWCGWPHPEAPEPEDDEG